MKKDIRYKKISNIIASNNFGDIKIFKGNLGIGKTNISMIYRIWICKSCERVNERDELAAENLIPKLN